MSSDSEFEREDITDTSSSESEMEMEKRENGIHIGINGFGRIGRMVLRTALHNTAIKVVAINEPYFTYDMVHMFKDDPTHGRFEGTVLVKKNRLVVNGQKIKVFKQ
jgi:glyceraldehyde 3-phosphate dehydrogenase